MSMSIKFEHKKKQVVKFADQQDKEGIFWTKLLIICKLTKSNWQTDVELFQLVNSYSNRQNVVIISESLNFIDQSFEKKKQHDWIWGWNETQASVFFLFTYLLLFNLLISFVVDS